MFNELHRNVQVCHSQNRMNGQLVHQVWFKWKDDASLEQIQQAMHALLDLGNFPEETKIASITGGKTITERSRGFTHAITVVLENSESLEIYDKSSPHQNVVKNFIAPIKEDVMAIDYIIGSTA
jgi:Stress responsive A/B Barrel Domain